MSKFEMSADEAHEVVMKVLREKWLRENGYKLEDLMQDSAGRYFVSVEKRLSYHISVHYVEYLPDECCRYQP